MADETEKPTTTEPNKYGSVNPESLSPESQKATEQPVKRGPGRPPAVPKSRSPENSVTNYTPSVSRNEEDQAAQPTGTGTVAGQGGDWTDFDEANLPETNIEWKPEKVVQSLASLVPKDKDSPAPIETPAPNEKMFPVQLNRNYRPATERWYPILNDGRIGKRPPLEEGQSPKIMAGYKVVLPMSEAKSLIGRGLAVRADALPE